MADADAVDGERPHACDARGGRHRHRFQRQCARRDEAAIERGLSVDGLIVDAGIRDLVQEAAQSDAAVERELELARDSQRLYVAVTAQCTATIG